MDVAREVILRETVQAKVAPNQGADLVVKKTDTEEEGREAEAHHLVVGEGIKARAAEVRAEVNTRDLNEIKNKINSKYRFFQTY